jgi:hypothetical protein
MIHISRPQITFSISKNCFGFLLFKVLIIVFFKHLLEAEVWKNRDTADCKEELRIPTKMTHGAAITMPLLSLVGLLGTSN